MKKGGVRFDSRALMERAVDVMRSSIRERRDDGKASPVVGAVLWKPDGTVETSYRGELRDGDHAEFTLLERKNRSNRLDGGVLFTTLEPCAPGARKSPKLGCAERIDLARIAKVWVGIEDPDPTVDRKGLKFLEDHNVEIHMFDRDLQEIIRAENKEFIAQALERARAEREKVVEPVVLSPHELALHGADGRLLDDAALEAYRRAARIEPAIRTPGFEQGLFQQGLLREENGVLRPSGFALLLFGRRNRSLPDGRLLASIRYPDGRLERESFEDPLVLLPDRVQQWLRDKLPNILDRSEMKRTEAPPYPASLVREGILNAVIHRDYDIAGAKIQLVVDGDTIVIRSPGKPPHPITVEQVKAFIAPTLSRNPPIHFVFTQMGMSEEVGFGLGMMQRDAKALGVPAPRFAWNDPYLDLTIFTSAASVAAVLPADVRDSLSEAERSALEWLGTRDRASASEYAKAMGVDSRTARRHFNALVARGIVVRRGSGPATEYEVVR